MAEPGTLGDGLLNAAMNSCPQPVYAAMRARSPVIRTDDQQVLLVDHTEVMAALRDADLYSSDMDAVRLGNVRPLIPLQIDPPEHIKFRKLLDPLFSPREVARLEPEVRRLTTELIDAFAGDGRVELNTAFAVPLPCTVFLALLGLPGERPPEVPAHQGRHHPARRGWRAARPTGSVVRPRPRSTSTSSRSSRRAGRSRATT